MGLETGTWEILSGLPPLDNHTLSLKLVGNERILSLINSYQAGSEGGLRGGWPSGPAE